MPTIYIIYVPVCIQYAKLSNKLNLPFYLSTRISSEAFPHS